MLFSSRSIPLFAASLICCFSLSAHAQIAAPSAVTAPTVEPTDTRRQETPSILLPGSYWDAERKPLQSGDVAPAWVLPLASDSPGIKKGAQLDFARWRGNQKTVVVFWAFWCDTWKDATRYFGDLRPELEKQNIKLVMVAVDASQQPVARPAFTAGKLFFPIAIDAKSETTVRWGVRRVPSVFLVGSDGKIGATWEGLPPKKELIKLLKR